MKKNIPAPVIAITSELISQFETHATLDSLFMHAGAPGDPPEESKHAKSMTWLRRTNQAEGVNPLEVLGLIIETYMDEESDPDTDQWFEEKQLKVNRLKRALSKANLHMHRVAELQVHIQFQRLALSIIYVNEILKALT